MSSFVVNGYTAHFNLLTVVRAKCFHEVTKLSKSSPMDAKRQSPWIASKQRQSKLPNLRLPLNPLFHLLLHPLLPP